MPKWEDCTKIHLNCGGLCRWVEAVQRPAVGYHGECLHCNTNRLPVEQMIPLRDTQPQDFDEISKEILAELEWDHSSNWENNQERLTEKVNAGSNT